MEATLRDIHCLDAEHGRLKQRLRHDLDGMLKVHVVVGDFAGAELVHHQEGIKFVFYSPIKTFPQ